MEWLLLGNGMDNSKRGYNLRSGSCTPNQDLDNSSSPDPFRDSRGNTLSQLSKSCCNLETIFEDAAQDLAGPSDLDSAPILLQPPLFSSTHRPKELQTPDLSLHGIGAMERIQDTLDKLAKAVDNLDSRIKAVEKPPTTNTNPPPPPTQDDDEDPLEKFLDFDPEEIVKLTIDYITNPNFKRKSKTRDKEELEVLRVVFKYSACVSNHFSDEDRRILLKRVRFLYTALTGNWTRAAVDRRDLDLASAGISYSEQATRAKPYRRRGNYSSRGRGRGTRSGATK